MGRRRLGYVAFLSGAAMWGAVISAVPHPATAAEALNLPPAAYKPLPVGTRVKFNDRAYEVTETDGLSTVYRVRSETKSGWLKNAVRKEGWMRTYALFGELTDNHLIWDNKGDNITYEIDGDEREKLKAFWPLKIGNKVTFELDEGGGDCTDPNTWEISFEVTGAEAVAIGDFRYPSYVIEENGKSDSGQIYKGRRWYQPDAGLFVKIEREWIKAFPVEGLATLSSGGFGGGFGGIQGMMDSQCMGGRYVKQPHFGEGERDDYAIVEAAFPDGAAAHALVRSKTGAEVVAAEVRRLRQEVARVQAAPKTGAAPAPVTVEGLEGVNFGRYHALVIGVGAYRHMAPLKMAAQDAAAIAKTLETDYGFRVVMLIDPDRATIIDGLDEMRETLGSEDNLLIYYAGRGWLDEEADRGYWLPVNARTDRRSGWVSNADITDTLKTLQAKHVLVVADSCFSGTLTRAAKPDLRSGEYWKRMTSKYARVAITSGGLEPRPRKEGGNSLFAKAFLDALNANDGILDGSTLFSDMRRPLMVAADQTPRYADVREAGHEGGDFLFVRRK